MSSDAVTEKKPDQDPGTGRWRSGRELAPSLMLEDEPTFARLVGGAGVMFVLVGCLALVAVLKQIQFRLRPDIAALLAVLFIVTGVACLLFHAVCDRDKQMRRVYGILALGLFLFGVLLSALPIKGAAGTQFLPYGFICITLSLLFFLPFVRNETQENYRQGALTLLGFVGAVMATTGIIGGNVSDNFLLPFGLLLSLLGFAYLWAFVGMNGPTSEIGYRSGQAMGAAGVLIFLIALGRSVLPWLLYNKLHWISTRPEPHLVPAGLLMMFIGLLYAGLATGLCSENRLVVLTRRELASFFYSPVAYIVLFALTFVGALVFAWFVYRLFAPPDPFRPQLPPLEPVIQGYILDWQPVITVLFVVPVLTMRLMSEEHRSGTYEVLMTAPVGETAVVLSKFFAAWLFFMAAWLPWGLFLISMRIEGGQPFEYRPLLSFFIALGCCGAAFLSMGLFISSLTRNQIIAAVLTFVGMLMLFGLLYVHMAVERAFPTSVWVTVMEHLSFVHLWIRSLEGKLAPQHLLFQLSATVFWLFLTVKVLESRKWR